MTINWFSIGTEANGNDSNTLIFLVSGTGMMMMMMMMMMMRSSLGRLLFTQSEPTAEFEGPRYLPTQLFAPLQNICIVFTSK